MGWFLHIGQIFGILNRKYIISIPGVILIPILLCTATSPTQPRWPRAWALTWLPSVSLSLNWIKDFNSWNYSTPKLMRKKFTAIQVVRGLLWPTKAPLLRVYPRPQLQCRPLQCLPWYRPNHPPPWLTRAALMKLTTLSRKSLPSKDAKLIRKNFKNLKIPIWKI